MSLFSEWSEEQLRGISCAIDAAAGEGAFGEHVDRGIAEEICAEAKRRGLQLELANGHRVDPDDFMGEWFQ